VLAGLLLVLGPLMLGIAAMIGPYAMLHVMFAKMGVTGGVLTPILRGLGGAFMWAGRAVLWLGRALMLNPIGIAITVIAGAAFLIASLILAAAIASASAARGRAADAR